MIKKMYIICLLAILMVFSGCTSQAMTKNVINDIGGILDINRFQYYISSDIRLTATERVREPNVDRSGTARVREIAFRDIILMNLLALKGEVSCKRYIVYEVRSARKLFNCGAYYHFVLVLPILTALKGGVLDPTANKKKYNGSFNGFRDRRRWFNDIGNMF